MSFVNSIKGKSQQVAINLSADRIVEYVQKSPEQNFDKMMKYLAKLGEATGNPKPFHDFVGWLNSNPGSRQWFINMMQKDKSQLANIIKILFGNYALKWNKISATMEEQYGFSSPYVILISPTMRCNLRCKGCYAEDYNRSEDLSTEIIDTIITQGKELGTYLYTILGGEPFIRFDDLVTIAYKHRDCLFQIFTNGTLITEEIADKISSLNNIIVIFSVNGNKDEVDFMRGFGVYEKFIASMKMLNRRNLIFGMSMVLTSRNHGLMTSADFYKTWEKRGVIIAWNFLFMPVVKNVDLSLMPTPEQRVTCGEYIKEYREKHPLFIMDFWADAPAAHGCIAGGRRYLHINHKGDVEPCIFAHFATHNIKECTLLEALKSPFFTAIRQHQPHTDNILRPCMIIDNPDVLRTLCKKHNARPTAEGARELIEDPVIMQRIDDYAHKTQEVVDGLWQDKYGKCIDEILANRRSYPEGLDRISFRLNRKGYMKRIVEMAAYDQDNAVRTFEEANEASYMYAEKPGLHTKIEEMTDGVLQCPI
jgi:MoaA/NifB/PqqE/SkfB family radical SAM enzyme